MPYKTGDIALVRFPFTNLKQFKKRPVLIIKDENSLGDIVCFQITSSSTQSNISLIENSDIIEGELVLKSFVKYDKCFTISADVIEKNLAKVDRNFLQKIKELFCDEIF